MNDYANNSKPTSKIITFKVIASHHNPDIKTIHIIIEKRTRGYHGYAVNVEGITGMGNSIKGCQEDVISCIEKIKSSGEKNIPDILKGKYEIVYQVKEDQTIN